MKKNNIISILICIILITVSISSVTGIKYENKINNIKNDEYSCLINQALKNGIISTDIWLEQDKLIASEGSPYDNFGYSVALDGDYALVGAFDDDNLKGAAYVFIREDVTWIEEQKLIASDGSSGDEFGFSVSLDGNYALIGAYGDDNYKGSAYVFRRDDTIWIEEQKLTASDGAIDDLFGCSVSIDGDYAIIGAYGDDAGKGAAYVFTRSGTIWTEEQKLTASTTTIDVFGCSVSLDGDQVLIGAANSDNFEGAAYIFTRSGTIWTEEQKLTASDGATNDLFGFSVSLDGDYSLIGAHNDDGSKGSAYVFRRDGTVWTEEQKLTASDGVPPDLFGCSVSLEGDQAIIGAIFKDTVKGAAYIFTRSDTIWTEEQKLTASDGSMIDGFGCSVSLDGNYALIGAYGDDTNKGSAYVFIREFPESNLDCSGDLDWIDVTPGDTVYGSIVVENVGEVDSLLNWEIESYPGWGTWNFDPDTGFDLLAGDSLTINVEVVAPNEEEQTFTGEVVLVNSENTSDTCTISVSLVTPVNQEVDNHSFLHRVLERFPNAFPIIKQLLGL